MGLRIDQRIILVIRKTRQQELADKYGTVGQAVFHKSRSRAMLAGSRVAGAPGLARAQGAAQRELLEEVSKAESQGAASAVSEMKVLEEQSRSYEEIIGNLRQEFDFDVPVQVVDRSFVPKMMFGPRDVVVALGQDGLVANVAKYALGLPIIGVNPDPAQYDGVLLPFEWKQARSVVMRALEGRVKIREVTLAEARLNDGQRLLAFNDLFIGARSHVSARYRLEAPVGEERQSSSGIIVSTGAGSTGWLSSVFNMARGVSGMASQGVTPLPESYDAAGRRIRLPSRGAGQAISLPMKWEDPRLAYVVREPFASRTSSAGIVAGMLGGEETLTVESLMGAEGTIFSDGVEADALAFSEGMIASVGVAEERARLVVE